MKKVIIVGTLLLGILAVNHYLEEEEQSNIVEFAASVAMNEDVYTVVIDAGHGGYDSGSLAIDGTEEKEINLEVSLMLGELLEAEGINVVYIRDNDNVDFAQESNTTDLRYRVALANEVDADLYISIHCNASDYGSYYGFETWTDTTDEDAVTLAEDILSQLDTLGFSVNRGVKEGSESLYVVGNTNMTSCLVEIGFIDNYTDYSYISTIQGKQSIAQAIADAILPMSLAE
ncbi:N-acetylmuramoyl-L-alanine amidase [Breznakia pachnodae]|uniref:N-acetylmuramoyl-L-alanine amidase n=1 Tax=Breznakia pachnodae TaxID=265178 RepID=A0ABU0DYX5_9FIRM|nr:N-acetylmuramoyl-L-alanine amidase [Breznakia pachnodae]MDQ0359836.1 N-acetylmuramoyl-L-alanine amidase [Breznakia pachnodae]